MNDASGASAQGAFDLSSMASSGAGPKAPSDLAGPPVDPTAPLIDAPLTVEVTEANFEQVMALSQAVPVVLVLFSPTSLNSRQAVTVMEDVVRASQGAFQLGIVDASVTPSLVQAFQLQSLPAAVAILAGRPVPLFEGIPSAAQVEQVMAELFQVAPELGVVGRLNVAKDGLEKPMPTEHIPAREAEDAGDWEGAAAAWRKVIAANPGDLEAKTAMARAQFEARQDQLYEAVADEGEPSEVDSVQAKADSLFAHGDESGAFELLLGRLAASDDADVTEDLRLRLVELFQIAADRTAVKNARARLATILLI